MICTREAASVTQLFPYGTRVEDKGEAPRDPDASARGARNRAGEAMARSVKGRRA